MSKILEAWIIKGDQVEITWDDSNQLFCAYLNRDSILDCDFIGEGIGKTLVEALENLREEMEMW